MKSWNAQILEKIFPLITFVLHLVQGKNNVLLKYLQFHIFSKDEKSRVDNLTAYHQESAWSSLQTA